MRGLNTIYCLSSQSGIIYWLQKHMLPCPFKYVTGIDCPGCGFQRSVVQLLQGNFAQSWALYPGTVPLIILALIYWLDKRYNFDPKQYIKTPLAVITGCLLLVSYIIKMSH
jgi:hypothetical protein